VLTDKSQYILPSLAQNHMARENIYRQISPIWVVLSTQDIFYSGIHDGMGIA